MVAGLEEEAGEEEAGRDWRDREDEDLGIINLGDEEWPEVQAASSPSADRTGLLGHGSINMPAAIAAIHGGALEHPNDRLTVNTNQMR